MDRARRGLGTNDSGSTGVGTRTLKAAEKLQRDYRAKLGTQGLAVWKGEGVRTE